MRPVIVVVAEVFGEHRRQVPLSDDEHPVGRSRRTVPTHRSANEFARGARGGVLITSMPAPANTASKTAVNFVSRSRSRNRNQPRAAQLTAARVSPGTPAGEDQSGHRLLHV
jgi:hypothetical protein